MYIHVYECKFMHVHCTVTYTFMIVNKCMYIVHTRLRLYSSTTTLHFSSGPISLAKQASLCSAQAAFLQSCLLLSLSSVSCSNNWLIPVCACTDLICTMCIHCTYTFILCIRMHIPCTWVLLIICVYHFGVCLSVQPMQDVCTMLLYTNMTFCMYCVQTGIYPLRMVRAGGKLSCSIFAFLCTDIALHSISMYKALTYAF
jgi:hypothetical protein